MASAKPKTNAFVPGLILVIASMLIVFATVRPWAVATIPGVDVTVKSVKMNYVPRSASSFDRLAPTLTTLAVVIGVSGLLLVVTRSRWAHAILRLIALAALLALAVIMVLLWDAVSDGAKAIVSDTSNRELDAVIKGSASFATRFGLIRITPGLGLYALTVGTALCFIGVITPGVRRDAPISSPASVGSPRAAAGWYPVEGGQQYWDGNNWTEHFERF